MVVKIDGLPREVRFLLLDFDGTIIDIRPKWWSPIEESFIEIVGSVPEDRLRARVSETMANMPQKPSKFFLLKIIWEIGRSGGLSRWQTLRFVLKTRGKFSKSRYTNQLIPKVDDFLKVMDDQNVPIAIVTTADQKEIEVAKRSIELLNNYPVISRDDVENLKPHPEPVLRGVEILNADKRYTAFVGDFRTDIDAGKAAGVMTIGLTGFVPEVSKPGLQEANPDLIVQYLPDLLERIETLVK